jgi:hypothetical protein
MALGLAELGEDVATTAQRLVRLDVHPVVADDAATWAHRLVRARSSTAGSPPPGPAPVSDLVPTVVSAWPSEPSTPSDDAA